MKTGLHHKILPLTLSRINGGGQGRGDFSNAGTALHGVKIAIMLLVIACCHQSNALADEDPKTFIQFVEDFPTGVCMQRQGKSVSVKNTHATRKLRVVLDRYMGEVGTGDRSRSVLLPGAEPEALGCSRSEVGPQQWKVVKAEFVE